MIPVLWRSSLRYLARHPWQVGLSVLSIALGVAVIVSIDLANQSARRAFALSTDAVSGKATHRVIGGPAGLPEELYVQLRAEAGVSPSAPVVEGYAAIPGHQGRTFRLLGVDPFVEAPFRPYLSGAGGPGESLAPLLLEPGAVLLASGTARELGLRPGDAVTIRVGSQRWQVTLAGTLQPADSLSAQALEDLLVADISTAQELLGMVGRLSHIDLIAPPGAEGEALLALARAAMPPGVEIVPASSGSAAITQMTRAFNLNLTALSLLALIVGMFLIYNTMTFSVVQRRTLIGTLRAIGVTRGQVFALVLGEALVMGVLGASIGAALGVVMARGLVRLITQSINDLYFVLSVSSLAVEPVTLLKGMLLGLGATLLAALMPAAEATGVPTSTALGRSSVEARVRGAVPVAALVGVVVLGAGVGLLVFPSRDIVLGLAGLFGIVIGAALLTPAATWALAGVAAPLLGRPFGLMGRMAARGVTAGLSRTSIAIAALMVAVSVTVGIDIMVTSFRQTVVRWLEASLQADVYVSAPSTVSRRADATLDPGLVQRLTLAPGVAAVSMYRNVSVESEDGPVQLVVLDVQPQVFQRLQFKEGDPEAIWADFQRGEAVIASEPYAYHHGVGTGSTVRLLTSEGTRPFRVAGLVYDYSTERGLLMMARSAYQRLWDDPGVSSLGIYAAPGQDIGALAEALRGLAGPEESVLVRSNQTLRAASMEIFDRAFAVTSVVRLLGMVVAFIGVLSALMALQLERGRETSTLRAMGLTSRQVWGLAISQTGLMGLIAGLLAVPAGIALSAGLVFVVNRRSFGWSMDMQVSPEALLQSLGLALLAAILAGLYPALRMARGSPALGLREE